MSRMITVLFAVMMTLVGATYLLAFDPTKGDRDKVHERIETLAMWRMIEALDLDQPTADKILQIRHGFLSQRKELQKGLSEDFKELRKQLNDSSKPSDDQELARLLQNIHEKRKVLQSLREQQYEAVSKVLTVRQRAQLVLFFKDFHKEIGSLLRRPQAQGEVPKKSTDRLREGKILPDRGMGLSHGAAGAGDKAGQSPNVVPGKP